MNQPLFDRLPLVGKIGLFVVGFVTIPLWFPLWILLVLAEDRKRIKKERAARLAGNDAAAGAGEIDRVFEQIKKDMNQCNQS